MDVAEGSAPARGPEVGVVVALASELRTLTTTRLARRDGKGPGTGGRLGPRLSVWSGGMGANAAWAAAEELHRAFGARTLVSWGCAAGLTDDVRPGTVVVADRVVGISERAASQDEHAAAQASQWADRVAARLETALPVVRSPIACAGTVLRSGHDKRALAAVTGAAAADMETEAVARFARQIPGPWIAIRVVADDVHTTVPESALAAVDKLGRVDPIAFARALVRTPGDVLQMPAVARAFRRALESLRTARALLGDHLLAPGLPDRTPTASSERV